MMAAASITPSRKQVFVQRGVGHWWEVIVEGYAKSFQFSHREIAVRYARLWAAANRPSVVVFYPFSDSREQRRIPFDA